MTDSIIKGTGDSRLLRTVANAATRYPTYQSFIAALAAGTFPVDLAGVNPAGFQVQGTALNKAALLTDATERAIWGGAADRTVDEALDKIRRVAYGKANVDIVYKFGKDDTDENNYFSITFEHEPILVVHATNYNPSSIGLIFPWNELTEEFAQFPESFYGRAGYQRKRGLTYEWYNLFDGRDYYVLGIS